MAIDDFLARSISCSDYSMAFRVYRWSMPTLSCGFHQRADSRVDFEACAKFGVDFVRRPTGGRELLHDGDLSFSYVAKMANDGMPARKHFALVSDIIVFSLSRLGLDCTIQSRARKRLNVHSGPCLLSTAEYEIAIGGKKIVPIAQRIYRDSILIHGSIPLVKSAIPTMALLKLNEKSKMQELMDTVSTDLRTVSSKEIEVDTMIENIFAGCRAFFGAVLADNQLEAGELNSARKNLDCWKIKIIGNQVE